MLKILFMGTPEFAVPYFEALLDQGFEIVVVVTKPDRPQGRHLRLVSPPVKEAAQRRKIPFFQPPTLKDEKLSEILAQFQPDLGVVVAYGKILPAWLLSLPKYGCLNVHASLLPSYRGPAPIQRAIMAGDKKVGVTIQIMEEGLDTGDILAQSALSIEPDDTAGTIEKKLQKSGSQLLVKTIPDFVAGKISPANQDESAATYASKVEKDEAQIRWDEPAEKIRDLIRALNPHPGSFTLFRGKRLKVWRAQIVKNLELSALASEFGSSGEVAPGTIIYLSKGLVATTATDPLELVEVQPEARNRMRDAEFVRGYRVKIGEKLGV